MAPRSSCQWVKGYRETLREAGVRPGGAGGADHTGSFSRHEITAHNTGQRHDTGHRRRESIIHGASAKDEEPPLTETRPGVRGGGEEPKCTKGNQTESQQSLELGGRESNVFVHACTKRSVQRTSCGPMEPAQCEAPLPIRGGRIV